MHAVIPSGARHGEAAGEQAHGALREKLSSRGWTVDARLLERNALDFHSPAHAAWVVTGDAPGPAIRSRLVAFLEPPGHAVQRPEAAGRAPA